MTTRFSTKLLLHDIKKGTRPFIKYRKNTTVIDSVENSIYTRDSKPSVFRRGFKELK